MIKKCMFVYMLKSGRLLFYLFHEHFGGLESRNLVLGNDDGGVLGNVAGCLLRAYFHNEAAESAEENRFAVRKGVLNNFHEFLNGFENSGTVNAGCL